MTDYPDYFQGNSFGSDDHFLMLLEAKEQQILALRDDVEQVREQLSEYKSKEIQLCKLIQKLADRLRSREPSSVRESARGKHEIILTSGSTKHMTSKLPRGDLYG
jgi:uncharacterized protein with von Willebrand factor type A (vWA) domain